MPKRLVYLILPLSAFLVFQALGKRESIPLPDELPAFSILSDLSRGPKPTVYLRTDRVAYLPGQQVNLLVDMEPNGHLAGKTFFLYLQNVQTGEIRYLNARDGILEPDVITDLSGDSGNNIAAYPVPRIQDFHLFGGGALVDATLTASAELIGTHQFVLDVRDVSGRRLFRRAFAQFTIVQQVVPVTRNITQNTTWTNRNAYFLEGVTVFVTEGNTLTIEPGTVILGEGARSALVVSRGAKIHAEGTSTRPILFTSAQAVGERRPGDWGGVVVNGYAPLNQPGGEAQGEGDSGPYGGDDPDDNSGVIRYVRIEFGGARFTESDEFNGLAFQGVGRGTFTEYIQCHKNADDNLEFFGGTNDVKYALLTQGGDDGFDWTFGWNGRAQFVVVQHDGSEDGPDSRGLEADNDSGAQDAQPRSSPQLYNFTVIGDSVTPGTFSKEGVLLRRGTAGKLYNMIVWGWPLVGVDFDNLSTFNQADNGNLVFDNSLFHNNGVPSGRGNFLDDFAVGEDAGAPFTTRQFMTEIMKWNRESDPLLRDPLSWLSPDFRPLPESPALDLNYVKIPPDDGFFETNVFYLGGVNPYDDWTQAPWIALPPN
jgi:hypothetical protein